jgi:Fic family protein
MFTWQHPQWPNYHYDKQGLTQYFVRYAQTIGNVTGCLSSIDLSDLGAITVETTVSSAVDNSAIEGEYLNRDSVRMSVMKNLGVHIDDKYMRRAKEEGVAAMALESRNTFDNPLSKSTLDNFHKMALLYELENPPLFIELRIGDYRTCDNMRVTSKHAVNPTVYFEAPPGKDVPGEMERFIEWFNASRDDPGMTGVERAAIAHLWFETIHPYDDGNGRVGRAVADKALSQDIGHPTLACLSTAILEDKAAYYKEINKASKSMDITDWVEWFTRTTIRSYNIALDKIDRVLDKTRFWNAHEDKNFNARQEKALNKMFTFDPDNFGMTAKKYMSITRCSKATATRDITELRDWGCLHTEGMGRSVRYNLSIPCLPTEAALNIDLKLLDDDLRIDKKIDTVQSIVIER